MGTRMEVGQLESRLSVEDYENLQNIFLDPTGVPGSLSREEFTERACSSVGRGSGEEYGLLFDGVVLLTQERRGFLLDGGDAKGEEGHVDWEGLSSFLLLELSDKAEHARANSVPRWKPPRTVTSPHRDPVQQVLYLLHSGRYLSVSKGATLVLWAGEDLSPLQTHRLHNNSVRPKDLWVTDMVLLHNVHKLAVSFTSKEVCFYDLLSKQEFGCQYKLQGLKFAPLCLDYWADPSQPDKAILTIGDTGGQVNAVCFKSAQISLFERPRPGAESESTDIIRWEELTQGKHCCCYTLTHRAHAPAWVRRVRYLSFLEAFVSCSTSPQNSMVIGWRDGEGGALRVTCFRTQQGVRDLDYHPELNLIATAGVDHRVLLWKPYVSSEPAGVLSGHVGSVTAVRFIHAKKQLLSYSKDKVLCVWDVASELCVHRLTGVFPKTQEDTRTLLYLHEERQRLLLSFNSLLLLLEARKEERRTTSHEHPVTCVLYNSLFRQVVSSDTGSSVICWLVDTGKKVKQFHRCHGDAEISSMALDVSQTRLFTAGTDGEVKVWDFKGHCHHRLNAGRGQAVDICQLLLLKRSILVMGWERMLTVFRLHSFSQFYVEPSEWKGGVQHQGDVLCAAFQPPQTLVTGSCDGEITVWNNSTENALRKLRTHAQHNKHTTQQGPSPVSQCGLSGEMYSESCDAVTRLFFIPGRAAVTTATGGADLVSCGGSGTVRFWNTARSALLGQFTAHSADLGSVIMAVSPCGTYLITADVKGRLNVWDIQDYCLQPCGGVANVPPALLRSLRPHLDRVTHLETCIHGDRLLLLSAATDCSVALSYLPGDTVGIFGQEDHWRLETLEPPHAEQEQHGREHTTSRQPESVSSRGGTLADPVDEDRQPERKAAEGEEPRGDKEMEIEEAPTRTGVLGSSSSGGSILGRSYEERWDQKIIEKKNVDKDKGSSPETGTFSGLRMEDLQSVGQLSRPDFVTHPQRYFNKKQGPSPACTSTPSGEALREGFDERSLFPKDFLESEGSVLAASSHKQEGRGRVLQMTIIDRKPKGTTVSLNGTSMK